MMKLIKFKKYCICHKLYILKRIKMGRKRKKNLKIKKVNVTLVCYLLGHWSKSEH